MATSAPAFFSKTARSPRGALRRNRDKTLKSLLIVVAGLGGVACGGSQAKQQARLISDLQVENQRLEARLTDLTEKKLSEERRDCELNAPLRPSGVETTRSRDHDVPDLPVVKLGPGTEPAEEEEGAVVSLRPAAPVEETAFPDDIRPVLKVSGAHEAWVYERRVDPSEASIGSGATSTPASD